ncbi:MAG: hypothetical protein ACP5VR_12825 [Acidimicrobiales bacterium]
MDWLGVTGIDSAYGMSKAVGDKTAVIAPGLTVANDNDIEVVGYSVQNLNTNLRWPVGVTEISKAQNRTGALYVGDLVLGASGRAPARTAYLSASRAVGLGWSMLLRTGTA